MEDIIFQSPSLHPSTTTTSDLHERANGKNKRPRIASLSASRDSSISWGRQHHYGSWLKALACAGVMLLCPCLVIFYCVTLDSFNGSILSALLSMQSTGFWAFYHQFTPRLDSKVVLGYCAWLLFQVALYQFLPSELSTGQLTPAGNLLRYRTNGLRAWIVTHVLFIVLSVCGVLDPAIIAKNWGPLLVCLNVFGFLLTGFAYAKAHLAPTHEKDRKFTGSMLYDLYMGVELNPRFGRYFDFKLFTNGRPGIIAWTLIDLSFIAYQYQTYGSITNTILISTGLHVIYVVDFFINEDWYLRTIDICHDHFGFYLAWGSIVWLPSMYTLQTQFLARNPSSLPVLPATLIAAAGVAGYVLFRSVNHQKDLVRRTKGDCMLWGKPAEVVRVSYRTNDGREHESLLLCSGWWGLARHVNYAGDLLLSYSMCATCIGSGMLLPWTYAVFMTILLVHRCKRDEKRCQMKYGKGWDEYVAKVGWVIVPWIY